MHAQQDDCITIRTMAEHDILTISEAFGQPPWNKPAEQYRQYFREQLAGERLVLLTFWRGDFAGYGTICWTSHYAPFAAQGIPEIVDLNVLESFRRKGIASRLMDRAEAEIAARSAIAGIGVGLYPGYGPAQRMYVRRGYVPDGRGLLYDGQPVEPGTTVRVDDALTISLTRTLR